MLAAAVPPVPPLDEALPLLLAPGLRTSLAVHSAVYMRHTPVQPHHVSSLHFGEACGRMCLKRVQHLACRLQISVTEPQFARYLACHLI